MTGQQTPATPVPGMTRRELEARIIAKAWKDPNYKRQLLSNPKAVLQQEISAIDPSVSLPPALQVQVHEEAPNAYQLVLPRNPRDISLGEVLGDNLEAVAPQTVAVVVSVVQNVVGNVVLINAVNTNFAVNAATLQAVIVDAVAVQVNNSITATVMGTAAVNAIVAA